MHSQHDHNEHGHAYGDTMADKNWIQGAVKHPGALRKQLHVKGDGPIPAKKLNAAAQKGGKLGQRARLAKTLKGMHGCAMGFADHGMQMGASGFGLSHGEAGEENS